jgi:hypothetical protein
MLLPLRKEVIEQTMDKQREIKTMQFLLKTNNPKLE